jgi:outer membrane protein assembly factor BamD
MDGQGSKHMMRSVCISFLFLLMALSNMPAYAEGLSTDRSSQEMELGRYRLEKHNYLAAINRFRGLISEYPDSPHAKEALGHLVEAYLALGIVSEAQTIGATLRRKFPDGKWTAKTFADLKAWGLTPAEGKILRY